LLAALFLSRDEELIEEAQQAVQEGLEAAQEDTMAEAGAKKNKVK
jgi:hypothetical protein